MRRCLLLVLLVSACDGGLAPPEGGGTGVIQGVVRYTGRWPSQDSLVDLRFVAMRFIPKDTTDFLQLGNLVFTPTRLRDNVTTDTFVVPDAPTGNYLYSGVAQHYSTALFAWRPLGLVAGPFTVRAGETTRVTVDVDFSNLPPFPPR
jgi:hypothetical protein